MNAPTQLLVLRHVAGLTQYQLGKKIGRNPNWIGRVERGLSAVSPEDIDKLAAALGVSPALLRPLELPRIAQRKGMRRVRAGA